MLDISPPFSVEIERSVIGCLLVDPSLYHSSLNYDIQEFDFWIKDHRAIW